MPNDIDHSKTKNILRLNDAERKEVEAYLERWSARQGQVNNGRSALRFRYAAVKPTVVEITGQGVPSQSFLVLPKDLSQTGFAFIHGAFVYPGSRCGVSLWTRENQCRIVPGTVVRCQHLRGRAHEVGVRFEQAISPEQFVDARPEGAEASDSTLPAEEVLDTSGVRRLISELAAIAGARDCPAAVRKKIHQLAAMADLLIVDLHSAPVRPAAPAPSDGAASPAADRHGAARGKAA